MLGLTCVLSSILHFHIHVSIINNVSSIRISISFLSRELLHNVIFIILFYWYLIWLMYVVYPLRMYIVAPIDMWLQLLQLLILSLLCWVANALVASYPRISSLQCITSNLILSKYNTKLIISQAFYRCVLFY